jgi:spermidine/putrescine transport system substrate-binding protein
LSRCSKTANPAAAASSSSATGWPSGCRNGGYLQELDHRDLPTVLENIQPRLKSTASDPRRSYSIPWQSNLAGIWIDKKKATFSSIVEFFGPDIRDEITMDADMRESVPLVILAEGKNPVKASTADWLEAIKRIRIATEVGQIHALTGSEYTEGLNAGELIAAVGRPTDAVAVTNPNAEWVVPDQGCVLYSTDMVIPVGAPNTAAALAWMNYVYQPEVAADISEGVLQLSPVEGVNKVLESRKSKVAQEQPLFPGAKITRRCSDQANPPNLERVNEAWQEALEASQ